MNLEQFIQDTRRIPRRRLDCRCTMRLQDIGVLVSMLAMVVGARREAFANVRPERILLISADAPSPVQSNIPKESLPLIRDLPGLKRNAKGEPIVVLEALGAVRARYRSDGHPTSYIVHGVTAGLTDYLVDLHLTSGRLFRLLLFASPCH